MSRRKTLTLLCCAAALLGGQAFAQTMEHPCDSRALWPAKGSHDKLAISSEDGLYFAAAFDFLTLQSDKVKNVPNVARLFNKAGIAADGKNPREKIEAVDKDCAAAGEPELFVQCDAVMNRVYLGAAGMSLSQGRWLSAPGKDATLKEAREALTLVCDQSDARRTSYAKRLRQDSDAAAVARAKIAPAYEEASMIPMPQLGSGVDPNDPRLQSMECRHLCEAYLAFGVEGCFSGMTADEKKWCLEKEQAVKAEHCACR